MVLIARLDRAGMKSRTIARIVSKGRPDDKRVSHVTVTRWLQRAKAPSEDIQMALAGLRHTAVESWHTAMVKGSRYGKHAPAKDLLVATGDIDKDIATDRLVILVGDGRTSIGTLPQPDSVIIDAEPAKLLPEPADE
jgi:hypothetical protein